MAMHPTDVRLLVDAFAGRKPGAEPRRIVSARRLKRPLKTGNRT